MEATADGGPATCAACGARRTGSFCAACGQRAMDRRHSLRGLLGGAFHRLFNVESGLVHTAVQLTVDPGKVVRDYLAGRTVVYVHPVAYLIIAFAAFALTFRWTGGAGGGSMERVSTGAIVFFLAAASRIVFWRAGLNLAEHLVLNLFLFAQSVVFVAGALILAFLMPEPAQPAVSAVSLAAVCAYIVWGYARVFATRPALAALRGLVVLMLGAGLWGFALAVVGRMAGGG